LVRHIGKTAGPVRRLPQRSEWQFAKH
jgi:hypothetical protein